MQNRTLIHLKILENKNIVKLVETDELHKKGQYLILKVTVNSERPTKLEARQRQSLPTPSWKFQSRYKAGNTYKKHMDQKNRTKTKDKGKNCPVFR